MTTPVPEETGREAAAELITMLERAIAHIHGAQTSLRLAARHIPNSIYLNAAPIHGKAAEALIELADHLANSRAEFKRLIEAAGGGQ
jgi:hypothetical protein